MTIDKILTVNEVAEILQVKPITVREMFRDRRLRAFKVGKAWRTTEKMLGEDIEAIARGESPADLPMMGKGAAGGVAAEAPAPVAPEPKAKPKKRAPRKKEAAPDQTSEENAPQSKKSDDDSQQMLF
jgi:excisionase family DNA binding protein